MGGEVMENPVTGETMRVLESTAETFVIEYVLKPHGEIPLEHFHPNVEQEFSVRSGEMHVRVNGSHAVIKAGETLAAPPGAVHFQWNPHDVETVAVETYRPAGRNHDFFRTLFGLARDGHTDAQGMPSLLVRAAIFSEFHDTIRPAAFGVRCVVAVLAPLSRVLGYGRLLEQYRRPLA
jgi:quercetin dioxygenase-like cupin family protein